ncbi:S1 family peptidase [Nonomuraea angiospora]|uniref:S1 family peptidase n=1 Tax=Nonomuraea angiospora TaxID=46172 RepID=UPI0038D4EA77
MIGSKDHLKWSLILSVSREVRMKRGLSIAATLAMSAIGIQSAAANAESLEYDPLVITSGIPSSPQYPTLDRLAREAEQKGISLKSALDAYASNVISRNPSAQGAMPDGPVPDPTIKVDGIPFAELIDLNRLAGSKKISFKEAIDRYAWTPQINSVAAQLRSELSDDVTDIAIVDEGRGVRIGFKGEIPKRAADIVGSLPVQVRLFPNRGFSEKELQAVKDAAYQQLRQTGKVASAIAKHNAETGEITFELSLKDKATDATMRAQAESALQPPAPANDRIRITIKVVDRPNITLKDKYIRGGGLLDGSSFVCTNGFNVINSSTGAKASLTARHCADLEQYFTYRNHPTQADDTTTLSRWYRSQNYDMARYDKSSTTAMTQTRTFYYDWNLARYAHDVGTSPVIGQPVCKFGRNSGATCDNIVDTNVDITDWMDDGKQYRGNIETDEISVKGDSGGPLYYGNRAWGILSAGGWRFSSWTVDYWVPTDRVNDADGLGTNWSVWTCPTC